MTIMGELYSINAGNFVLASIMNDTDLLYRNAFPLSKYDFKPNLAQRIVYITTCQLADRGCKEVTAKELVTYLENGYTEQYNALKDELSDGNIINYVNTLKNLDNTNSYEYWYNELRKRSMLRRYNEKGNDISKYWNFDKSEEENVANLNKYSIADIVNDYELLNTKMKQEYVVNEDMQVYIAGQGFKEIKEQFKQTPLFGACLMNPFQTTLYRGWLKTHLLLNSAPSSCGKTTRSVGELCNVCATELYDKSTGQWHENLNRRGAGLYYNTEMDVMTELTPIFVAYIADVPRSDILDGKYASAEDEARVDKAIQILEDSHIVIVNDPKFTLKTIENNIKINKQLYDIQYMVFDYFQDNGIIGKEMKDTHEVVARDTIILNLGDTFKFLAEKYDIGVYSMTQLNGQEKIVDILDESCLAGGRAVKNKVDAGSIMLPPRKKELKFIDGMLDHWRSVHRNDPYLMNLKPNNVLHHYKTRFNKYGSNIKIYEYFDKGTGHVIPMFCTTAFDEPLNIEQTIVGG